jgi:tetratricopeptide (TPR) repeat protein
MEHLFADKHPDSAQFANTGRQGVIDYFKKLSQKYQQFISPNPSLIDLSFYYVEHNQGEKAVSTMQYLVDTYPDNTFYLSRLAKVYDQLGETEKSRLTLQQGIKLATKLNNQDALTYFKGELSKL